jgi:hypothetical protein
MSITQRYWLTFAPGLIFAGFISVPLMIAFFLPSYLAYFAHKKEWTLGQFAWRATAMAFAAFMFLCLIY